MLALVANESIHLPSAIGRLNGFNYGDSDATYSVTLCVEGRQSVFSSPVFAQRVIDCLHWLRTNRGLVVYAYCLMPDHLHLLVRPQGPLGAVIKSLKAQTTRDAQRLGRPGKLWQDNCYDHVLRKREDANTVARYILFNPVRADLVAEPDDFPWAGLLDPM
jgi:putative transposase